MSLVGTVSVLSLHYHGDEERHRRLDQRGAIAFPVLYALGLAIVLAWGR